MSEKRQAATSASSTASLRRIRKRSEKGLASGRDAVHPIAPKGSAESEHLPKQDISHRAFPEMGMGQIEYRDSSRISNIRPHSPLEISVSSAQTQRTKRE